MSNFTKKHYDHNDVIFRDGDEGKHLCEILEGEVYIYKNYKEAGEQFLARLEAGAYFGEMGLIENLPRSATAVAKSNCELLLISEEDFEEYLKMNPVIAMKIMKALSTRLRTLTGNYMEACGTIAEALQAEETKKSKSLLGRLKKFADIYVDGCGAIKETELMGQQAMFYRGYHSWY